MKKYCLFAFLLVLFFGCFSPPDITPPMFIPKSPPDSLEEKGIDAHPENAIYLEWEEPATVADEGIMGYYIYRGKLIGGEYSFKRIDRVEKQTGSWYDTDNYIDYDANLDTTYYYYLKSYNDFTVSSKTSDTVMYKLSSKPILYSPAGEITTSQPIFNFRYYGLYNNSINRFYLRLYKLNDGNYDPVLFIKVRRVDVSKAEYDIYLNNNNDYTIVLYNSLPQTGGLYYLEAGNYRWRIDAIASRVGGAPEVEGAECDWFYFNIE